MQHDSGNQWNNKPNTRCSHMDISFDWLVYFSRDFIVA